MVGYPGQFDVFLAKMLANRKHKPLVWDVLMSIYLVALERQLDQVEGSSINFIRKAEAKALKSLICLFRTLNLTWIGCVKHIKSHLRSFA